MEILRFPLYGGPWLSFLNIKVFFIHEVLYIEVSFI